jgi:Phage integrase family
MVIATARFILTAYRHGLRASEVCDLQWHQIELDAGRLHVRRAKHGTPSVHPIRGDEIRALRKLRPENPSEAYIFVSERGGPISPMGFHHLIQRLGKAAKMPFAVHPHMLRHACGFKLANDGHDTRALQERPPDGRAAKQRDELAASHSSISSAATSNVCGIERPRALAVFRLTISSNLVGCRNGKSAGLSPLRNRLT